MLSRGEPRLDNEASDGDRPTQSGAIDAGQGNFQSSTLLSFFNKNISNFPVNFQRNFCDKKSPKISASIGEHLNFVLRLLSHSRELYNNRDRQREAESAIDRQRGCPIKTGLMLPDRR